MQSYTLHNGIFMTKNRTNSPSEDIACQPPQEQCDGTSYQHGGGIDPQIETGMTGPDCLRHKEQRYQWQCGDKRGIKIPGGGNVAVKQGMDCPLGAASGATPSRKDKKRASREMHRGWVKCEIHRHKRQQRDTPRDDLGPRRHQSIA